MSGQWVVGVESLPGNIHRTLQEDFGLDDAKTRGLVILWWLATGGKTAEDVLEHVKRYYRDLNAAEGFAGEIESSTLAFLCQDTDEWLIDRLFALRQPAVIAGPSKACKTTIAVDLAVSLDTATPFLGHFAISRPRRVFVLSVESGDVTLAETATRICAARGLSLRDLRVRWGFRMGKGLARKEWRDALAQYIRFHRIDVAIIDPLYLAIGEGANPASLNQMVARLGAITSAVLEQDATPILVAHTVKDTPPGHPLQPRDLSGAGLAEFFRSWLLVNRLVPFDPARPGSHRLVANYGGSNGHCGVVSVDIEEGVQNADMNGRKWEVRVGPYQPPQQAGQRSGGARPRTSKAGKVDANAARVLEALKGLAEDQPTQPIQRRALQDQTKLSGSAITAALTRLEEDGAVTVHRETHYTTAGKAYQRHSVSLRSDPSRARAREGASS
jgi:hypothetical protein